MELARSLHSHLPTLEGFYRFCANLMVHVVYRTDFKGFDKLPSEGGAMLIANHISYMDGLVIHAAVEQAVHRRVRFVMDEKIFNTPLVNYFMSLDRAIPISTNRTAVEKAIKEISAALNNGELVCIFPEGRITYTGNMNRFRMGIEWIMEHNKVPVYPIALKGLWGSIFSRKYLSLPIWLRFIPRSFRSKITAICGDAVPANKAKVSHLQRVLIDLVNCSHNLGKLVH